MEFWPLTLSFDPMSGPRQNFSLKYQSNVKQTSDEKKEKYQQGEY